MLLNFLQLYTDAEKLLTQDIPKPEKSFALNDNLFKGYFKIHNYSNKWVTLDWITVYFIILKDAIHF